MVSFHAPATVLSRQNDEGSEDQRNRAAGAETGRAEKSLGHAGTDDGKHLTGREVDAVDCGNQEQTHRGVRSAPARPQLGSALPDRSALPNQYCYREGGADLCGAEHSAGAVRFLVR